MPFFLDLSAVSTCIAGGLLHVGVGSMSSESDSLLVVEQSFFVLRLKSAEE